MTITTDFAGGETAAVTKARLTAILEHYGKDPSAYTTWGNARTDLNALLTGMSQSTIGATEVAGTFRSKLNYLNDNPLLDILELSTSGQVFIDNGILPYHYFDFISNRALYASVDVGNVTQATGYTFTRASQGYYTNADGTLTLFGSGALRRGDRGVLIEGARTNLLARSQEFDNAAWSQTSSTITADAATAPDGTLTADFLVENTASGLHGLAVSVAVTATAHSFSFFLKPNGRNWVRIGNGSDGQNVSFGLTGSGTVSTAGGGASGLISALANGWYRCTVIHTPTVSAGRTYQIFMATSDGGVSYTGDGTSGIFIWGAQLEAAFPSSYIPTTTTSVLRSADVLTYTAGLTYPLGLWAEFERAVDTGADEVYFQIDDGSINNRAVIFVTASDLANGFVRSSNVTQMDNSVAGAVAVGAVTKTAVRVATNDGNVAKGGTLGTQDTSLTLPATPSRLVIGSNGTSAQPFGYIRRIAAFNFAPIDAQLQAMTT